MPTFIKFLAEGRGLWGYKGLIWSHNPFPFDYQLLNWSLLNMAACEDRTWDRTEDVHLRLCYSGTVPAGVCCPSPVTSVLHLLYHEELVLLT